MVATGLAAVHTNLQETSLKYTVPNSEALARFARSRTYGFAVNEIWLHYYTV